MTAAPTERHTQIIEVISVFATRWKHDGHTPARKPDERLGRLAQFYDLFRDKLPQLLDGQKIPAGDLEFEPEGEPARRIDAIFFAELQLFVLPSHQVVAALIVFFHSPDLNEKVRLAEEILDLCGYAQVTIRGVRLPSYIGYYARSKGAYACDPATGGAAADSGPPPMVADGADILPPLPPEQHQIMFVRDFGHHPPPGEDVVNRILYRTEPPYREEVMKLAHPVGLNRQAGTFAAVTPYVSFIYGHEDFVDYSIFLTTVQAVGTAAQFREIWYEAYQLIRTFRRDIQEKLVGRQQRQDMEELVDALGNLQLDLSFSVETSADLGLLIPSLRIESFHRELYDVLELPARAHTVSRMFDRLESSIQSELTAIGIRERNEQEARRQEQEARRRDWVIAAGFLSAIGVPLGFLVAFFGINARQVDPHRSVFDLYYLWVFIVAAVIAVLPVAVLIALRLASKGRRQRVYDRTHYRQQLPANVPTPVPGGSAAGTASGMP